MKGYSFTPAKSRPSSLISSSEHTEQRGGHKDYRRDHEGCRGSHSCNCRSGSGMGNGRVKLASWVRLVATREIQRWRDQARVAGRVKSYGGNHGKAGKIGEGHGIFGWPLWLRHVRSIIPSEHRTILLLTSFMPTRILICFVC